MKRIIKHYITLNNKKFFYTLKKVDKLVSFVQCEAANISQKFLNSDIPDLLIDLPNLILAEHHHKKGQSELIRFRVTPEDKRQIEKYALQKGYQSVSGFIRDLALGNI